MYSDRLAAPFRNFSSIRKEIPTTFPPSCCTRLAVVFDPADHERMILDPDSWQGSKPRRS